jgi:hypothetical protein
MINKLTAITNEALRERWSTVSLLTLILTLGKAYSTRAAYAVDAQGYIAQVFVALIVSFIVSMIIHILLFILFSPRPKPAAPIVSSTAPVKTKAEHEAAINAVHKEFVAVEKTNASAKTVEQKTVKPFDLHKELGIPKRTVKKSAKKSSRKTAKKAAAKKKK